MSSATARARSSASRAANSKPLEYLARGGFIAYGVIHLLLAYVAMQVAFHGSGQESDQAGALRTLAGNGFGKVLLVVIAVGMIALAVWQGAEAAVSRSGKKDKQAIAERVLSGIRAIVYLYLAWLAIGVIRGANTAQSSKSQNRSAGIMAHSGGRWLIGLVGLVVIGVGIGIFVNGLLKKFEKNLNMAAMRPSVRKSTRRLGMAGYMAKGVAYGVVGVLVVSAAVTYDPKQAGGMDSALKTLAGHTWGVWLLVLIALGFAAFGIFCFSQAKYRKV